MLEAINELNKQIVDLEKQIADAKKNKEDESVIKDLENQVVMLKKQVAMMQGLNKTVSGISEKTFQQAGEEEPIVPKKDDARINMLPKRILTEAELILFIKNIHGQVEKMIPAAEKTDALKIYTETKTKYNSSTITGNAASSCWMLGHSEKAVYIMGRACLDDISNTDNLSNYAAFLIMSGGEQAALPILEYLNNLYPKNSTLLNNIGQAWFGLGDMDNAKKHLDESTLLYPGHSMSNTTLSDIYQGEGDNEKAISFLKASLKEAYDPDKEARLAALGYNIIFDDMPPLNYPMKDDPFGLIPLINSWPETIQTNVDDPAPAIALQHYYKRVNNFDKQLSDESKILSEKEKARNKKLSIQSPYTNKYLEAHNTSAYKHAARSRQLIAAKAFEPTVQLDNLPVLKLLEHCQQFWFDSVLKPTERLTTALVRSGDCGSIDAVMNAYLQKKQEIYRNGVKTIKEFFINNSRQITWWIKHNLYGTMDEPPRDADDYTYALTGELETTMSRNLYQNSEYKHALRIISFGRGYETVYKSYCDNRPPREPDPKYVNDPLVAFNDAKEKVKCEFIKKVVTSDYYMFDLKCNTIWEKIDSKLPKRKSQNKIGAAKSTTPRGPISSRPPLSGGPSAFLYDDEIEIIKERSAPLNAEDKDSSQFSFEYDRWGNFVGFNFQLNKEGTALADPKTAESGIESRWSWDAIASPKKGFLNKLVIK